METTKNSDVRVSNRKRVVNTLFREGAMTKHELALKLDISLPTVTLLIKELTQKGLITKGEILGSTGGRKPVCIAPVYNAKYAIGAELSQHELRIVLVDLGANVIAGEDYPLEIQNSRAYWEEINQILMSFVSRNVSDRNKLLDIGIALQLPMENGSILFKNGMAEQYKMDLDMAAECFELSVKFYNSAKVSAIAQVWASNAENNFVYLALGSYIGGAMVYEGVIVDFPGRSGEFGSIIFQTKGRQERIDEFCTTSALCRRAEVQDLNLFFEKLEAGDKVCCELWEEYLEVISIFLHNIHSTFGWKIVIGGSLAPWLEKHQEPIRQYLKELDIYNAENNPVFRISDLGKFGAAIGAALLPSDKFLEFGYDDL